MNLIKRMNNYFLSDVEEEITVSDVVWFYGCIATMLLVTLLTMVSTVTTYAMDVNEHDGPYYGTNVGDGEVYTYTITAVIDGEVHGIPVTKASEGNRGIFLYADELDFIADEGDVIEVVWGEEEDVFERITLVGER